MAKEDHHLRVVRAEWVWQVSLYVFDVRIALCCFLDVLPIAVFPFPGTMDESNFDIVFDVRIKLRPVKVSADLQGRGWMSHMMKSTSKR